MKAGTRNILIKLIYLAALGSIWSAAVLLFKSVIFESLFNFFDLVSILLCIFAGYGFARLINKASVSGKAMWLILFSALLPVLAGTLIYRPFGNTRTIIEVILLIGAYFAGVRSYYKGYTGAEGLELTLPAVILTVIGIITAMVNGSSGYVTLKPLIFFYIYLFIIITFILKNQKIIDFLMIEMSRQTPKLPSRIHSFNLSIMLLAALLISLIAFAGPVINTVSMFFKSIGKGIRFVIARLLKLLSGTGAGSDTKIQPQELPKTLHYDTLDEKVVLIILAVIGIIIVVFIAMKLPQVYKAIKKSLSGLIAKIKSRLQLKSRGQLDVNHFDDEVVFSKAVFVDEVLAEVSGKGQVRRSFPKKDPVLQVRYYYGVVLDLLIAAKIKLAGSDTTGQIRTKAYSREMVDNSLAPLTELYNRVRYDNMIPEPGAVEKAEEGFRLVKSALNNNNPAANRISRAVKRQKNQLDEKNS